MNAESNRPLFSLGQLLATPGALEALSQSGESPAQFLKRHVTGDWGDLCEEDKNLNTAAPHDGGRIFSAYHTKLGTKLWIITEAADENGQRLATTILLPDEY